MYFSKPLNKPFLGMFLFLGIIAVFFVSCSDTETTSKSPAVEVEETAIPAAPGADVFANAGPFCITFDSFCDSIEVSTDAADNAFGRWDWACGGTVVNLLGDKHGSEVTVTAYIPDLASLYEFRINIPAGTFDLWCLPDAGGPPVLIQVDQPFTVTAGACPFAPENGLPSTVE